MTFLMNDLLSHIDAFVSSVTNGGRVVAGRIIVIVYVNVVVGCLIV